MNTRNFKLEFNELHSEIKDLDSLVSLAIKNLCKYTKELTKIRDQITQLKISRTKHYYGQRKIKTMMGPAMTAISNIWIPFQAVLNYSHRLENGAISHDSGFLENFHFKTTKNWVDCWSKTVIKGGDAKLWQSLVTAFEAHEASAH